MPEVMNWQLNRDDAVSVRGVPATASGRSGVRHQQVHRLPDVHDGLQDVLDLRQRPGVHALEQRRDQAVGVVSAGVGRPGTRTARPAELGR